MQSEALQDYVKNIYMLQASDGRATTSGVAERLGVSAASATAMFKKLAEAGLVEHRPYHGAVLTDAGEVGAVTSAVPVPGGTRGLARIRWADRERELRSAAGVALVRD